MTFTFRGVDAGATRVTKNITRGMKEMGDTTVAQSKRAKGGLKELAGAYNSLIVAKKAAQVMGAALKPAMEMEHASKRLAIATGLNAAQVKKLEMAARSASQVTPFTPAESIEAATRLNMALRNVEGTAKALTPTMSLATTFLGGDFNKAALTSSRIVGGFRLNADQLADKLDSLVAISRAVGTPISRMDEGFKKLGEAAQFMNGSFEDMVTMMALAVRGGTEASRATTGMRTGIMRMARPQVQDALGKMGVRVMDSAGNFRNLKFILLDLAKAQEEQKPERFAFLMDKAFGARSVGPWITSINQLRKGLEQAEGPPKKMADAFAHVASKVHTSKGLLNAATREGMKPLSQQILLVKQNLGLLMEQAFAPLVADLAKIAAGFIKVVQAVTSFIKTTPGLLPFLTIMFKIVGLVTMIIAAKLAWAGAVKIVATALVWLNANTKIFTTGMFGAIRAGHMQAMAAYQGARANGVLAASMRYAGVAARTMWSRVLGPIGLVIALWGILKSIGGAAEDATDLKLEDVNKAKKEMAANEAKFAAQQSKMLQINSKLGDSVGDLSSVIKEWKNVQKAKLPLPSSQVIKDLNKHVARLGASGKFSSVGLQRMHKDLTKVNEVQRKFAAGEFLQTDEVNAAREAMWRLTMGMKSTFPLSKKFLKGLDATGQAYENAQRKSQPMARTMQFYGFRVDELREKQKQAILRLNEQRDAQKFLLESQKQQAKQTAIAILGKESFERAFKKGGLQKAVQLAISEGRFMRKPGGTEMTTMSTGIEAVQRDPSGRAATVIGSVLTEGVTRIVGGVVETASGQKGLSQQMVNKLPSSFKYDKRLGKYSPFETIPENIRVGFQQKQTKSVDEQMRELLNLKGSMGFWRGYQTNINKFNDQLRKVLPNYEKLKAHGKMAAPVPPKGGGAPTATDAPSATNQHLERLVTAQENMGTDQKKKQQMIIDQLKKSNTLLLNIKDSPGISRGDQGVGNNPSR